MEERILDARRKALTWKKEIDRMTVTAYSVAYNKGRTRHLLSLQIIENIRKEVVNRLEDGSRLEVIENLLKEMDELKSKFDEEIIFDVLS